MPLILRDKKDKFSLAVWQITEDLSFFLERMELYPSEKKEIENFKDKRMMEWIASRYLLSLLENNRQRSNCLKDKYGKPYLDNSPENISISHSGNLVAACISDFKTGIDIQIVSDKINRIKYKFLSEEELKICADDFISLNRYWTAKEALYKAYGKKGLNFIENIMINPFVKHKSHLVSKGTVSKDKEKIEYDIYSITIKDSILTIAIEKQKI